VAYKDAENAAEYRRAWKAKNREKLAEQQRQWVASNKEKAEEASRKYKTENREALLGKRRKQYADNPGPHRDRVKEYAAKNPDAVKERQRVWYENNRAHIAEYVASNKDKYNCYAAARRVRCKLPISPAEQAEIEGMYLFCKIFPKFEVDHIIPLKGKMVSGLHVLSNLQILPKEENRRKANKFIELGGGY